MPEGMPPPQRKKAEQLPGALSSEEKGILDTRDPGDAPPDPIRDAQKGMTRRVVVGSMAALAAGVTAVGVGVGVTKLFEREKASPEWITAQMNAIAAAGEARSFLNLAFAAEAISKRALSESEEVKVYGAVANVLKNLIQFRMSEIGGQGIESPEQRTAYIAALGALVQDVASVETHVPRQYLGDSSTMRGPTTEAVTSMVRNVLNARASVGEDIPRMSEFEKEIHNIPTALLWNAAGQGDLLRMVREAKIARFQEHVRQTLDSLQISADFDYPKKLDIFRGARARLQNDLNQLKENFSPEDESELRHYLATVVQQVATSNGVGRL